jgi:hypothetical protein
MSKNIEINVFVIFLYLLLYLCPKTKILWSKYFSDDLNELDLEEVFPQVFFSLTRVVSIEEEVKLAQVEVSIHSSLVPFPS